MTSHVSTDPATGSIVVACIQMQPAFGNVAANVGHSLELIDQAASHGANLVVLPELANTGYMFASREEAFSLAEQIPGGPSVAAWAERAARHGMHIVAGITERSGPDLYNSAVVIGPEGYIGTFRKVHLWNEENLFFEPGDLGFPVFHTPIGRIGVAICYDGWFPETFRLHARCRAPISSACRPTGFRFPVRPKGARRWRTSSQWPPRTAIRSSSLVPTASESSAASPSRARA